MENRIYIASSIDPKIENLQPEQWVAVQKAIDSLKGDGWKTSEILRDADVPGEVLRVATLGDVRVVFSYAAEKHALIVVDVEVAAHELAVAV